MTNICRTLWNDEAGFIVSGELVLISTIAVLGLVVGLAEIAGNVNQELEDVGSAFGSVNQSFKYNGSCGHKGHADGSSFQDRADDCDNDCDINGWVPPTSEK